MKRKIFMLAAVMMTVLPSVVNAELVGKYSWGYFYSIMNDKQVISECDPTGATKVQAIAVGKKRVEGPWTNNYKASIAKAEKAFSGNRTGYDVK